MKKIACYFSATALIMSLSIACTKETDQPQNNSTETPDVVVPEGTPVVMKVTIPGDMTRVSVNQDTDPDGAILLAWEDTDVIRVINHDDATVAQEFEICEGFTAHNASFAGTHFNADSYDILYGAESVSDAQTEDYTEQVQTGNGSTAHIQYMACLTGVDTYSDVEFSSEWAEAHGGSFKENSVLRVRVQLPDNVASVKSVTVTAGEALSYTLTFENPADVSSDHILVAYMELPWENIEIPTGTDIAVSVETADHDVYHRDDVPAGGSTLAMGKVNAVKINCNTPGTNVVLDDFAGGEGTASSPWLVGNARQLQNIQASLVSGEKKYFKMIDDVDLQGVEWMPLNNVSPYDKAIDFDGNSKNIKNLTCTAAACPSFLGVLNGDIKDVTFKTPAVGLATVGYVGVVAGGVSAAEPSGSVSNVVIDGGTVTAKQLAGAVIGCAGKTSFVDCRVVNTMVASTGASVGVICGFASGEVKFERCSVTSDKGVVFTGGNYAGGIIGRCSAGGSISNCTVAIPVSGGSYVGGLVGQAYTQPFSISNSCMLADVAGTANNGGLVGAISVTGSFITNSYATGGVTSTGANVGGLVGQMSDVAVSNSYATGNVSSTNTSVGGIVGSMTRGTVSNCYATGDVSASGNVSKVGGLVGSNATGTAEYSYATGNISGVSGQVGGLIGLANTSPTVNKCIAWNASVSVTSNASDTYSCASVVGTMYPQGTATGCVRKSGFSITGLYEETDQTKATYNMNGIFDQNDVTSSSYLQNNMGESITDTRFHSSQPTYPKYPYHGMAAGATETLSDVAKRLGWDATVWDLSGNEPKLNTLK